MTKSAAKPRTSVEQLKADFDFVLSLGDMPELDHWDVAHMAILDAITTTLCKFPTEPPASRPDAVYGTRVAALSRPFLKGVQAYFTNLPPSLHPRQRLDQTFATTVSRHMPGSKVTDPFALGALLAAFLVADEPIYTCLVNRSPHHVYPWHKPEHRKRWQQFLGFITHLSAMSLNTQRVTGGSGLTHEWVLENLYENRTRWDCNFINSELGLGVGP